MNEIIKSGNRICIFDDVDEIPSIQDIILFTEQCNTFINSVTLNPKWVNAYLYSLFEKENYSSFIYALAVQLGQLRTSSHLWEPFEMNSRRIERLCKRRGISLSSTEAMVIDKCKNLHSLQLFNKEKLDLSQALKSELADYYL